MEASMKTLLVALLVLVGTSTASAECAWVVWRQILIMPTLGTPPDPARSFYWDVVNAYETRDACQQALKPEEERTKRRLEEVEKERREGKVTSWIPPLKIVCLPDTVDPRGPKGK